MGMKIKTVLVTAIGSFSAEAVMKACKRDGYRVVGCDIYPAAWVVNSMEADCFYQAPLAADEKAYREFLRQVCRQEAVDYVLPLTDVEIDAFWQWQTAEEELGAVVCMSGRDTIALCRNKQLLEPFLRERKLCRTIPGQSLSGFIEEEEDTGYELVSYPVILKPQNGRSSQGLWKVENPQQMRIAAEFFQEETERYLVQPHITGDVVTVDVVRNPQTGDCVCLPRRELLRTLNGAGTSVYVFRDEMLEGQCRQIAEALDICGCVNFEWIEHEEEWYFLECNPRFSGGVAFSCMAGYDMVGSHMRCFEGKEMEPLGEVAGQYLARRYGEHRMKE